MVLTVSTNGSSEESAGELDAGPGSDRAEARRTSQAQLSS